MIYDDKPKSKAVQEDPSKYEIFLGIFNNQHFSWFSISKHVNKEDAYKEFKKYVNKQLQYSDEELKRVWDTGRLDVELKYNNKTLNWIAIYCREVQKMTEKEKADLEEETKPSGEASAEKPSGGAAKPSAENSEKAEGHDSLSFAEDLEFRDKQILVSDSVSCHFGDKGYKRFYDLTMNRVAEKDYDCDPIKFGTGKLHVYSVGIGDRRKTLLVAEYENDVEIFSPADEDVRDIAEEIFRQ